MGANGVTLGLGLLADGQVALRIFTRNVVAAIQISVVGVLRGTAATVDKMLCKAQKREFSARGGEA